MELFLEGFGLFLEGKEIFPEGFGLFPEEFGLSLEEFGLSLEEFGLSLEGIELSPEDSKHFLDEMAPGPEAGDRIPTLQVLRAITVDHGASARCRIRKNSTPEVAQGVLRYHTRPSNLA